MGVITGTFKNINNSETFRVTFTCPRLADDIVIGENENSDVWFGPDPVEITRSSDSSLKHVIMSSCQINLVSKIWLGDYLFAEQATSIPVRVDKVVGLRIVKPLFYGYVEPQTYSQPYANRYNEININCVDTLSILEDQRMTDLGVNGTSYKTLKEQAGNKTFYQLITTMLDSTLPIYYDASTGLTVATIINNPTLLFSSISISSILWLGKSADDMMTNLEILEAIMQYLDLYIIQSIPYNNGSECAYYIFDNNMIKQSSSLKWINLKTLRSTTRTNRPLVVSSSLYAADDTNVTMAETFNQISVKASADSFDTIINNPLDTQNLNNPFGSANRYMTEFITLGEGEHAAKRMRSMLNGEWYDNEWGQQWFRHWYVEYLNNPEWKFNVYHQAVVTQTAVLPEMLTLEDIQNVHLSNINSDTSYSTSLALSDQTNQWVMTRAAQSINGSYNKVSPRVSNKKVYQDFTWGNCIGACMFNQFSTGKINKGDSSSAQQKVNNKNVLAITINNLYSQSLRSAIYNMMYDSQGNLRDQDICLCDYNTTGGAFVPVDDEITYYLVFSGSMMLSPFIKHILDYESFNPEYFIKQDLHTMQSQYKYGNNDHCFYTRVFYNTLHPGINLGDEYNTTTWKKHSSAVLTMRNILPYIPEDGLKLEDYEYASSEGDTIEKVGVLVCRLQIGDKYLNEEVITNADGSTSFTENYTWTTDSSAVFTIGFDPKIGDYIVGQEYKIGKDISMYKNIDTNYGMAIPIKRSDQLSGNVRFQILYPTSIIWNKNTKRHKTLFRHTKWTSEGIDLFNYNYDEMNMNNCSNRVENIFITELKAVLYSDNGGKNWNQENDIVYISNEQNKYIRANDDVEFKIVSGLTTTEANQFGVSNIATINSALTPSGSPVLYICKLDVQNQTIIQDKPERIYVNDKYLEYCTPRQIVTTTLKKGDFNFYNKFRFGYFPDKQFIITGDVIDLKYNTETITTKEI